MIFEQAIDEFRKACIAKGSEGGPRDHALYDRMVAAYRKLRSHGPNGIEAFATLLQDPSPDVRTWVAAQLLATGNTRALPVLEELANGTGMIAFNAKMTLREYSSGSLSPPLGEQER